MHSNVTINNVRWPHFSWPTLYTVHELKGACHRATTEGVTPVFLKKTDDLFCHRRLPVCSTVSHLS